MTQKFGRVEAVLLEEVITEILSWIPVKPLLRFRCVCKFWKTLISNPQFVKLHLQRSPRNANLLLTLDAPLFVGNSRYYSVMSCSMDSLLDNSYIDVDQDDQLLNCNYNILGSSNGLVCLHTSSFFERPLGKYWVRFWNPEMRLKSKDSPCLRLSFNELRSAKFGFGYDKSSDTYKVVTILNDKNAIEDKRNQVKLYTMGDSYWRDIQRFPDFLILSSNKEGKFLNDTLNWLAIPNSASSGCKQLVIVSLDLGKETYRQMLLPDGVDQTPDFEPKIWVRGCLCLFHDYKRTHLSIWQMKEFGVENSWAQLVNVSYEDLEIGWRFKPSKFVPLYISGNGDVLMLLNHHLEIILYKRRGNRVEHAKIRSRVRVAKNHIQSLISPC